MTGAARGRVTGHGRRYERGVEKFRRRLYDLRYLVGDKWALAILVTLSNGPIRRVEILSTINSYSIGEEWSDKHAVLHDSMWPRTFE
jgi:DNA-binding HxlR family transcriptional regulator